jgi:hypothetical protein
MKQFIVDRHTTPNTPKMDEVPNEKIPIYDSLADAEADLANLEVGQIGATSDTGSELSAPTDTVQSGNMHAVTSNAVAEMFNNWTFEGQGLSNEIGPETVGFSTVGKKFILIVFRTSLTGGEENENLGSVLLPISLLSYSMLNRGYITYAIGDFYLRYTVLSTANNRLSLNFTSNRTQSVGAVFSI